MLGGYGSAKTQWAVAVGVALTLQIPGNVGFVLRRSYPKLRDSVLRVYLETLERVGVAYETAEHEQGMPLRVVVPATGSEIRFRESTQLSRLLSTECGWFHLEEAWEEPKSTWAHLVGRLRLRGAFGYLKGLITSQSAVASALDRGRVRARPRPAAAGGRGRRAMPSRRA